MSRDDDADLRKDIAAIADWGTPDSTPPLDVRARPRPSATEPRERRRFGLVAGIGIAAVVLVIVGIVAANRGGENVTIDTRPEEDAVAGPDSEPPPSRPCAAVDDFAEEMRDLGITYDYDPSPSVEQLASSVEVVVRGRLDAVRSESIPDDPVGPYLVFTLVVDEVVGRGGDQATTDQIEVSVNYNRAAQTLDAVAQSLPEGASVLAFLDNGPWPGGFAPALEGFWVSCGPAETAVSALVDPLWVGDAGTLDELTSKVARAKPQQTSPPIDVEHHLLRPQDLPGWERTSGPEARPGGERAITEAMEEGCPATKTLAAMTGHLPSANQQFEKDGDQLSQFVAVAPSEAFADELFAGLADLSTCIGANAVDPLGSGWADGGVVGFERRTSPDLLDQFVLTRPSDEHAVMSLLVASTTSEPIDLGDRAELIDRINARLASSTPETTQPTTTASNEDPLLVMGPGGLPDVRVGMRLDDLLDSDFAERVTREYPGESITRCHLVEATGPAGSGDLTVLALDGLVAQIAAFDGPWRSDRGPAIGSSRSEVIDSYGEPVDEYPNQYSNNPQLFFDGAGGHIRFEIDLASDRVVEISAGTEVGLSLEEGCS